MTVSVDLIKRLRRETGAGFADCKNALREADGDIEKAKRILIARGMAKAAKKAARQTNEGVVAARSDGRRAAMIELNCETDFVARNERFLNLVKRLLDLAFENRIATADELLKHTCEGKTVQQMIKEEIAVIGENIRLSRVAYVEAGDNQRVFHYVHFNNRIGVIAVVGYEGASDEVVNEFGKKLVLQIASMRPRYLSLEDIPRSELEEQKMLVYRQALSEGKPEHIARRIAEGKVRKLFAEEVLMQQPYFEEPEKSFDKVVKEYSERAGGKLTVAGFVRFEIGM